MHSMYLWSYFGILMKECGNKNVQTFVQSHLKKLILEKSVKIPCKTLYSEARQNKMLLR